MDKLGALETLFADVVTGSDYAAPPRSPCPACGVETKPHHDEVVVDDAGTVVESFSRRICSARGCRHVFRA